METKTTQKSDMLEMRRTYNAAPDAVFKAWTTPAALVKWWAAGPGMSTPFAEVDLRVGGKYRLAMQAPNEKEPYIVGGTFKEVNPPRRLVYTWAWEGPHGGAGETLVAVEFHPRGSQTEVVLTHSGFADAAQVKEHTQGWEGCLENLAKVL